MDIQVKKVHTDAILPSFAHDTDAGMDLYSVEEVVLQPGQRVQVPTGIAMAIPEGYAGLIWDKSGISHKAGVKTLGGVVDAGYRGEILVGLVNTSDTLHTFAAGDKIAQMLIQQVMQPALTEVDSLDQTSRGADGFGSTGV